MITAAYTQFFAELEANNQREWFQANKKRYESDVKAPFGELIASLMDHLHTWDERQPTEAKHVLFRINRDIRFSKDKSPYNTLMKANFSPGGRKSGLPGYYLGIGSETVHLGGGLYELKPPVVRQIRDHIAADVATFQGILQAPAFRQLLGSLQGERAKRLDKEHAALQERLPEIAHKQFYAMAHVPVKDLLQAEDQKAFILQYFEAIRPLDQFLEEALSL